jgi:hypothetical protein
MGRNPHPNYLYLVKKDLTWIKVDESKKIIKRNFLCFVKTVFVKNQSNYTYSEHFIFDKNMNQVPLSFVGIKSGSYFNEFWGTANHCASIKLNISDTLGHSREFIFSHYNEMGWGYSDIDGRGILSIIDALKIMKELDELKS